jgi:hypothetical protein
MFIKIFIILGIIGGVVAFVMAFIITYEEYRKHFFAGYRPYKEAFNIAIMAFFVILFIMIVSGIFLSIMFLDK